MKAQEVLQSRSSLHRWTDGLTFGSLPSWKFTWLLTVPSLVAMGVSGYLAYSALTKAKIAGCSGGLVFDCGSVLTSKWSLWNGVPVSLLAFVTYVLLVGSLFVGSNRRFSGTARQIGWSLVTVLGFMAGLAALWFIALQAFVLKHFCTYCLTAHACGLMIAASLVWRRPCGTVFTAVLSGVALTGFGIFAAGQIMSEEPPKFEIIQHEPVPAESVTPAEVPDDNDLFAPPDDTLFEPPKVDSRDSTNTTSRHKLAPADLQTLLTAFQPAQALSSMVSVTWQELAQQDDGTGNQGEDATKTDDANPEPRVVSISGGSIKLDIEQWPCIGNRDASHMFVEMFDYTCPHCRKTHQAVDGALQRFNQDLAIVSLPVPLNTRCNSAITSTGPKQLEACELATLAVAAWRVDRDKFQVFHRWLFQGQDAPRYAAAKQKANELFGQEAIDAELAKPIAGQYIAKHVEIYRRVGAGIVPKLLFSGTSIVGEFTSVDSLVEVIKREAR